MRRMAGGVMGVCVLGGIVFAALLLITPPVASAPRLITAIEQTRSASPAGHTFPARFSYALTGLENWHHSRSGPVSGAEQMATHLVTPSTRAELALSDQLASALYLPGHHGVISGIERVVLALKLNWSYSRKALVSMYAAVADFGHRYFGLVAASRGYFGRPPARLSWAQMAMLAALSAKPSADDPYAHFARAKADQAAVLEGMVSAGIISSSQAHRELGQPLHLVRLVAAK
ncbi:MAG TPA: transglycosylase domain-containing protein [Streptosporangiaceae bacterium]